MEGYFHNHSLYKATVTLVKKVALDPEKGNTVMLCKKANLKMKKKSNILNVNLVKSL